ncbi:hypothetical protein Tco_1018400 [Tanacetum coccineum]|uniref:Secreted protein n=1 Tax=Tanacetum coccineum TaxID=301880 RepID=A0ABQ5FU82_9ASTR
MVAGRWWWSRVAVGWCRGDSNGGVAVAVGWQQRWRRRGEWFSNNVVKESHLNLAGKSPLEKFRRWGGWRPV